MKNISVTNQGRRKIRRISTIHENKPFYRTDAWKYVRSKVYERENGCCQRCGRFVFGRSAHVHHVIPIKEDSTLKLEENNLRLLCPVCHTIEENEDKPKSFSRVILEAPYQKLKFVLWGG